MYVHVHVVANTTCVDEIAKCICTRPICSGHEDSNPLQVHVYMWSLKHIYVVITVPLLLNTHCCKLYHADLNFELLQYLF